MRDFIDQNYRYLHSILIAIIVVLAFLCGFAYARKSAVNSGGDRVVVSFSDEALKALEIPLVASTTPLVEDTKEQMQNGTYFGSKNGTKFYTVGCKAGDRIKEENKVWFSSVEDATLQGYSPASC